VRELIADLFISLDGFASGTDEAAYFGYFGQDLGNWVREHPDERQVILMGRVTYEALARFAVSATDEVALECARYRNWCIQTRSASRSLGATHV
jgi:hypothetical protein